MNGNMSIVFLVWIFMNFVKGTCGSLSRPEQVHISYGDTHSSFVVMWSSRDSTEWQVHYGKSKTAMNHVTNSSVARLPQDHARAAQFVYKAVLKNLDPGLRYFYMISSKDSPDVHSSIHNFHTLDPSTDSSRPVRFVVYGDMGLTNSDVTVNAIQQQLKQRRIDAIIHAGDIAYDLHDGDGKTGDKFMNKIQPIASTIPYMTCPGNHEIHGDFQSYRTRFSSPGTDWPLPLNKLWYSFDVGLVHFISYSTEVYFAYLEKYACDQIDWLKRDLETANQNRDKTPWIIAFGHRPMYCSNNNGDDCAHSVFRRWIKSGFEPLFHAFGVDLVLQAHEHSYERMYPMVDGIVERFDYRNPRAPVHVTSGAAGSYELNDVMKNQTADWSAFRASENSFNSFGILDVINRTHLSFAQIEASDNSTIDSFVLVQRQHGPFVAAATCKDRADVNSYCACVLPLETEIIKIAALAVTCLLFLISSVVLCICFLIKLCKRKKCKQCVHNACSKFVLLLYKCKRCKQNDYNKYSQVSSDVDLATSLLQDENMS